MYGNKKQEISLKKGKNQKNPSIKVFDDWNNQYYEIDYKIWQLTPVLLHGKLHGWRNLADYSPWGRKESDTTESAHPKQSTDSVQSLSNYQGYFSQN